MGRDGRGAKGPRARNTASRATPMRTLAARALLMHLHSVAARPSLHVRRRCPNVPRPLLPPQTAPQRDEEFQRKMEAEAGGKIE
jgi:hypothetical protein